jgi:squalene-hopene/tetraprenyl-beta-curcumene cyclase
MVRRPMLTKLLGKPNEEVRAYFVKSIPDSLPEMMDHEGIIYYPNAHLHVWRTAGLVQWDKHVTGKLSDDTERALIMLLRQQSSHGGFCMPGVVEIPCQTTEFELTLHAARAIVEAPGWLAGVKDADLLQRIERLKTFLRETKPRNDYDRAVRIGLAGFMPEVVRPEDRAADLAMLWAKQKPDGGWSTRNMSATHDWHRTISEANVKLIEGLPDAANPESDPLYDCARHRAAARKRSPRERSAHPARHLLAKTRAARQWPLVDAFALQGQFSFHHLHRHGKSHGNPRHVRRDPPIGIGQSVISAGPALEV